jgi:ribosomal protein S18 acetylase RimI-like enzyme
MEVGLYGKDDLEGIVQLCSAEGWTSIPDDPARAHRALTAPGVSAVVAREGGTILGFAYLQSDGEIQAHLSLIAVDPTRRREGIARKLLDLAFREGGGLRIDLVTEGAEGFYEALTNRPMRGFRVYPPFI